MKLRCVFRILMVGALATPAMAQTDHPQHPANDDVPIVDAFAKSPDQSETPPDPQATLNWYEQQMAIATVQTYTELAQIAQAVHEGQMSSDQAQYLARRCYELGIVRLQFLDTLRQITQGNVPKQKREELTPGVQVSGETLKVIPPAGSSDIPKAIAKYLELTPAQLAAIQARITLAKSQVQPLVQQLSQNATALDSATREELLDDSNIRKLASEQSHILAQVQIANSRLQRDIHKILTPEQRKRFEAIVQGAPGVARQLFAKEPAPTLQSN